MDLLGWPVHMRTLWCLIKMIIISSNLDYKFLTKSLILEIWSSVEAREAFEEPIASDRITRRQFTEILGCFLLKWTDQDITRDFVGACGSSALCTQPCVQGQGGGDDRKQEG